MMGGFRQTALQSINRICACALRSLTQWAARGASHYANCRHSKIINSAEDIDGY
jgi:hypothetical protein